jgi:predicted nucleotidyltransferase
VYKGLYIRKFEGNQKDISMAEKTIIKIIKNFANTLKKEGIHIDRVILYGSYVTGKPGPESDIDIAIVSRDFGKDRIDEGMFLFRIAGDIDSRIEPVPVSLESYEKDTWIPLIYEIREKGINLKIA